MVGMQSVRFSSMRMAIGGTAHESRSIGTNDLPWADAAIRSMTELRKRECDVFHDR